MSYADDVFIEMCRDILEHGTSTEGQKVRPHWPDGTPAHTIMKFCEINRFDLRKEFPMLTLRRTGIKSATDELLWIWQKKSNNIKDLGPKIWDEWADESGSIGKAYGYQLGLKNPCKDVTREGLVAAFPEYYGFKLDKDGVFVFMDTETGREAAVFHGNKWHMDQVDKVIYDLKNAPFGRRIMTTLWNPKDLDYLPRRTTSDSLNQAWVSGPENDKEFLQTALLK